MMFFEAFKKLQKDDKNTQSVPKFFCTKKFDNVIRDLDVVYWMDKDKLLTAESTGQPILQLRSRFDIRSQDSFEENKANSQHFIIAILDSKKI